MKRALAGLLVVALVTLVGCNKGKDSAGGPGATNTTAKPPLYGQADNTFNLTAASASLKQGETKTVSIGIKSGQELPGGRHGQVHRRAAGRDPRSRYPHH